MLTANKTILQCSRRVTVEWVEYYNVYLQLLFLPLKISIDSENLLKYIIQDLERVTNL